jgi:hypothetical protein
MLERARSHVYMQWALHRGNYRNHLAHALYSPPYIRLMKLMIPL